MRNRIPFAKIDPKGIPLAEVIAVHRQFSPKGGLPGNIGDAFLLATNPVFRNVREDFLRRGFRFTTEDPCHYFSFPLMSLDEIIRIKQVPYRVNFPWLEVLRDRGFTLTELKRSELQFNYIFHECAHFIAHDVLFKGAVPKNEDSLLKILVGEAFANSVECLASAFVEGEMEGYFLDANCHFRLNQAETKAVRLAGRKFGYRATALSLMGAFIYANFMYKKLGLAEREEIRKLAGLSESFDSVVRIGMGLSDIFRSTTTQLHLIKVGFDPDLEKLMRFDPVKRVNGTPALKRKLAELAEIAVFGL